MNGTLFSTKKRHSADIQVQSLCNSFIFNTNWFDNGILRATRFLQNPCCARVFVFLVELLSSGIGFIIRSLLHYIQYSLFLFKITQLLFECLNMSSIPTEITEYQNDLLTKGWICLKDKAETEVLEFLNGLGNIFYTTDVFVNPESKSLVTSVKGLDFHTDHHKANYIAWYCIRQTDLGGESLLVNAELAFNELTLEQQLELYKIHLFEHKVFPEDTESYPLVSNNLNSKKEFYYSFWLVNKSDINNPALKAFQKALEKVKKEIFKLEPRDLLIIDNHRILHGRTPIEGNKDRLLKRYWLTSNFK